VPPHVRCPLHLPWPAATDEKFVFVSKAESGWEQAQIGMGVRIVNGDSQCLAAVNTITSSTIEIAWCLDIPNEQQLQEELRAGEALRTFTCGLQRTKTYNELFDMNRTDGWDPAGYSSPRWCRTAKVSLKATGELPSSPAAALR
jgi:hypothetical protein